MIVTIIVPSSLYRPQFFIDHNSLPFHIFTLLETLVIFYIFDDHCHPQVWSKEDLLGGLFGNHRLWVVHLPFLVHAGLCHDDDYKNADADHDLMLLTYVHLKIMVVFTSLSFSMLVSDDNDAASDD